MHRKVRFSALYTHKFDCKLLLVLLSYSSSSCGLKIARAPGPGPDHCVSKFSSVLNFEGGVTLEFVASHDDSRWHAVACVLGRGAPGGVRAGAAADQGATAGGGCARGACARQGVFLARSRQCEDASVDDGGGGG